MTTATMTSGITASPSEPSRSVASITEVSGSPSITTDMAPIPIARPGTSSIPGRCDAAMPPAAPMNIAGNTGPPRKLDSESAYASPLHRMRNSRAPTDQPGAAGHEAGQRVLAGEEHLARAVAR